MFHGVFGRQEGGPMTLEGVIVAIFASVHVEDIRQNPFSFDVHAICNF